MNRYMTAQEVADELGIHITTVYAYVSRGLLRSEVAGDGTRTRRYYWEDVHALKQRQEQRHHPEKAAESALHFGTPVLESRLTLIAEGRLYYRGLDALELAQHQPIEAVAALLWTGDLKAEVASLEGALEWPRDEVLLAVRYDWTPFERFQALLPLVALDDLAAYDLRPASVIQAGARILRLLAALAAGPMVEANRIAQVLQQAWLPGQADAAALIDMALVLCADHELNVSSFTARCVASAGSTPYSAVIGGLAALQGTKHGGSTERVAAFLREMGTPEQVRAALANRLKRGEGLPGFGHRLYPEGDPRGRLLLDALAHHGPDCEALRLAEAVIAAGNELVGEQPNIDFALVIAAQALGMPPGAPLALFALGRTVGWIGHALEQYETDQLIRPRARYVGIQPQT
ncbi:MAG: citrate synthase family protein [Anaerolineae bacterium]|nr:citrate synthase family protein [Anaerolineae bacterium]